jgi:cytidylate kinase
MADQTVSVRVVTISASFGAGGSIVGPKVAERLGLPFFDRLIPATVAARLDVPLEDALSRDERAQSRFWQSLALLGSVTPLPETSGVLLDAGSDDTFRAHTEAVIRQLADDTGGVILGRAASMVLADRRDTLKVRLDGPEDRRVAQVVALGEGDVDEGAARDQLREMDRTWNGYAKRFYHADLADRRHYHLLVDSTVLGFDTAADLIVVAACAGLRWP